MESEAKTTMIISLIVGIAIILFFSITIIGTGKVGVKTRFGAVVGDNLREGIHFKLPFIEGIKKIDCRVQKAEAETGSASKDLQDVKAKVAVNFRVDYSKAGELYRNIGTNYKKVVIEPAIQECVKATTAKFTAEELITKRSEVSEDMKKNLQAKLSEKGIIIDNFNITEFNFSEEFNKAIESKQTSVQLTLKAVNDLERIKIEATQKVTQAEADAKSQELMKSQITPELIQLEAVKKWNGVLPLYSGNQIPFINIK